MNNLKFYLLLLILFLGISINLSAQQEPSPETKSYILDILQNGDYYQRSAVIGDATYMYYIPEVVPILEQTIWTQNRNLAYDYLVALDKYNSSNFISLSHQFIDAVDTMSESVNSFSYFSVLEMKVYITKDLMDRGDFSTVQYVFDLVEIKKPETFTGASNILDKIIDNTPQYENEAKEELIRITYLNKKSESYNAVYSLTKHYGSGTVPILASEFVNSTYRPIKALALDSLIKYGFVDLEELMRNRLITDSSMTTTIAERLLKYYPSAYNYSFIVNNIDQIANNRRLSISFLIQGYAPIPPDTLVPTIDNIENLISLSDTVYNYTWLGDLQFKDELQSILASTKINLQNGDSLACRTDVKSFQDRVDYVYKDSLNADPRFVTLEGWKFLYWNAQYILDRLPEPSTNPNLLVKLTNSQGTQIPASLVKYYDTSWKDAVNNGDGTFTVISDKQTVSLRMFYEYANQTVHNVTAHNNTYTFHTVNASVELKNSSGNLIDVGTVQYYAEAWRNFGTTVNGVANKELLPINYSFRMTYEYGSQDKQQDISVNPTVVFQTVNAAVELHNSTGTLIDQGTVQYYAGAWRTFGTTQNGVTHKELLPINYSFRMTYEFVPVDKQQNIGTNPTVTFSTVLCTVKVTKANGQPLAGANTKYYSVAWRDIGLTNANGEATKELLPKNLNFRAISGSVSQDKQQDIGVNSLVEIQLNVP
jgi:hypothetical protein